MTAQERAHVVQQLKESEKEYLFSIENVTEVQWNWKPAPDRWSVGQAAEHIMQAEVVLFQRIQHAVQSPANPDWHATTAGKSEMLERVMLDRSQKAEAPGSTRPQGLPKQEVVRRFKELRARIVRFAEETQAPLNEHTAEHPFPAFSTLNTYQWLLLVPLHNRRHDHQIAEVKAAPGYPK
jgi:DinB superfamily